MKNGMGESSWWLIEKDHDRKIFTVIGPINDDTIFVEKICSLRKRGRDVLISTADSKKESKIEVIEEYKQMLRYEYVEYDVLEN